jgi:hypothetical protein
MYRFNPHSVLLGQKKNKPFIPLKEPTPLQQERQNQLQSKRPLERISFPDPPKKQSKYQRQSE